MVGKVLYFADLDNTGTGSPMYSNLARPGLCLSCFLLGNFGYLEQRALLLSLNAPLETAVADETRF